MKTIFKTKRIYPIFVCQYHKEFLKKFGIESINSSVIYNGINVDFFNKSIKTKNRGKKKKFVQLSRFVEKKGHYHTIKAFELFNKENPQQEFELILVGDGELFKKIREQVNISTIKSFVKMTGWKCRKESLEILKEGDYYVQHSITSRQYDQEATSVSIMEAMSLGMPIISTRHAGIPEVVNNPEFGILVEEKNIKDYAKAIKNILSFERVKESERYINEHHNLTTQVEKILHLYKRSGETI